MLLQSRKDKALFTWILDVLTVSSVLVLLAAWIADLQNGEPTHLSPSFFETGFCNSPTTNTQIQCSIFDGIGGLLFIGIALFHSDIRASAFGMASYLFSHGYGHYSVTLKGPLIYEDVPLKDVMVLAVILSIGPLHGATVLHKAGRFPNSKWAIHLGATLAVVALVLVFKMFIRQANFVLLYINISIILTMHMPLMIFVGYTTEADVAHRVDTHPWYFAKCFTRLFILCMVMIEPFFCDAFTARIGGHFLFDVSLFLDAAVDLKCYQVIAETTNSKKKN